MNNISFILILIFSLCLISINGSSQFAIQSHTYASESCSQNFTYIYSSLITGCVLADGSYYSATANSTTFTERLGCSSSTCEDSSCYTVDNFLLGNCYTHQISGIQDSFVVKLNEGPGNLLQPNTVFVASYEGPNCYVFDEVDTYFSTYCLPWNATNYYTFSCSSDGKSVLEKSCEDSKCSSCEIVSTFQNGDCYGDSYGDYNKYFCGDATSLIPNGTTSLSHSLTLLLLMVSSFIILVTNKYK